MQTTNPDLVEYVERFASIAEWKRIDGSPSTWVAWWIGPSNRPRGGKSSAPRIPDSSTEFKSLADAKAFVERFYVEQFLARKQT
jgi:hypothetical protein